MSAQEQEATTIITALPESTYLGEMLLFPRLRTHADTADRVRSRLTRVVEQLLKRDPIGERYRRVETATPSINEIVLEVSPKKGLIGWDDRLPIRLPVVAWQETERHHIGYLPTLGIEVVAKDKGQLLERAESYAKLLLSRMRLSHNLQMWVQLARLSDVQLAQNHFIAESMTPLQLAKKQAAQDQEDQKRSELEGAASDLTKLKLDSAYEIGPLLNRLAETLTATHSRPVLLVGPSGVGKTAAIHELVRQRQRFGLNERAFWQTDGPRLVAGMTGFGMWQERCMKIVEEARRSNAILFLGNLVELMQVGQHEGNEQGIASFFKPYLMRGEFQAIAECTDEQRKLIELQDPHLLSIFEELPLQEPDTAGRRRVLQAVALQQGKDGAASIGSDSIQRLDDLHQRFATYSVAPGRPIRFLKNLIRSTRRGASVDPTQVTRAFAQETGLPLCMIDETVKFEPDRTRSWFGECVIGQPEAVKRIVDVLTVVKANLSRPSRPIASLLFIGPTGVGKTQMAKSLAEHLFGDIDRMTRFDMSEYSDAGSVTRLTQAPSGASGAATCGEGLLTAKVREQPFGVLLFDEFEKAHPSFFDLLLQILGEGRLTDGAGRLADFTNTVIIMTSNLGAQAFQADPFGFATGSTASHSDHFVEAVRGAMRPELFNRIDRIVPFELLDREQVRAIVARELDRVRQRDGLALRNVDLAVRDEAIDHLVTIGFDAKLGARPLQRAIERQVLAPLADQINRYGRETALRAEASISQGNLRIDVRASVGSKDGSSQVSVSRSLIAPYMRQVTSLRRKAQRLVSCSSVIEIRNEVERLRRIQHHRARSKRSDAWTDPELRKLSRLEAVLAQIDSCCNAVETAEDDLAARLYTGANNTPSASEVAIATQRTWRQTLLDVYCRRFKSSDELLIVVYSNVPMRILPLIEAYRTAVTNEGASVEYAMLFTWTVGTHQRPTDGTAVRKAKASIDSEPPMEFNDGDVIVWRSGMKKLDAPLRSMPRSNVFGVLLCVRGPHVAALMAAEAGVHRFRGKDRDIARLCYVDTSGDTVGRYRPPEGVETSIEDFCEGLAVRRAYDSRSSTTEDKTLNKRTGWSLDRCAETLPALIVQSREKLLEDMIIS